MAIRYRAAGLRRQAGRAGESDVIRDILNDLHQVVLGSFRDRYAKILEDEIIGDCQTLLDLGCGSNSPIQRFSHRLGHSVGVDAFEPSVCRSKARAIHNEHLVMDVTGIGAVFGEGSFDCVLAADLIEHLPKPDGLALIETMEKIADRKVIILTPNGFLEQPEFDDNRLQAHLSGWEVDEMRQMGYRVRGVNGWKPLRGARAKYRWRPTAFWSQVCLLTEPIVANHPKRAFQILCVKEI